MDLSFFPKYLPKPPRHLENLPRTYRTPPDAPHMLVFRKMTFERDKTVTSNKLPHHRTLSGYLLKARHEESIKRAATWSKFWCVLRKGTLSWHDAEHEDSSLKGKISVKSMTSIDIIPYDDAERNFSFRVRSKMNNGKVSDTDFSAESLDELSMWVRVLNDEHDILTSQ